MRPGCNYGTAPGGARPSWLFRAQKHQRQWNCDSGWSRISPASPVNDHITIDTMHILLRPSYAGDTALPTNRIILSVWRTKLRIDAPRIDYQKCSRSTTTACSRLIMAASATDIHYEQAAGRIHAWHFRFVSRKTVRFRVVNRTDCTPALAALFPTHPESHIIDNK